MDLHSVLPFLTFKKALFYLGQNAANANFPVLGKMFIFDASDDTSRAKRRDLK